MSKPPTLACIGFGEAASAFATGWGTLGRGGLAVGLRAFDIKTTSADPVIADGKWADYRRADVDGRDTLAAALDGVSVVFSLVTADQAGAVAAAAAPLLAKGALFLDCNSCAPGTKRENAEVIEAGGGRYVDVAVMAPVHPRRHKTPLLLCGPHAVDALDAVEALDMNATLAEGPVGRASSIKMIRSIMMKGMEALFAECVLAGRRAGVDDVVLESLDATYPGFDFQAKAAYMLERSMTHGLRRAAEMREVAKTVRDLGILNGMAAATVDWQQAIGALALTAGEGDYRVRADQILVAMASREGECAAAAVSTTESQTTGRAVKEYADIPGTVVFDGDRSREGYHLNMFCMSLRHAANREAFKADEEGYLSRFPMTEAQRRAVLDRDWNGLLLLGGNIYYTSKLAATDGITFQQLAAKMTGVSEEEYRRMMLAGGRPVAGNRYRGEEDTHG